MGNSASVSDAAFLGSFLYHRSAPRKFVDRGPRDTFNLKIPRGPNHGIAEFDQVFGEPRLKHRFIQAGISDHIGKIYCRPTITGIRGVDNEAMNMQAGIRPAIDRA